MKKRIVIRIFTIISLVIFVGCNGRDHYSETIVGEVNDYYGEIITEYFQVIDGDARVINSIDDLASIASHIVRAEVLDNRVEEILHLLFQVALQGHIIFNRVGS